MYKRATQGWMKHLDFIVLDVGALQLAYIIAYWIRQGTLWPYGSWLYRNLGLVLLLQDVLTAVLFNTMHHVLKRGYYLELSYTVKHTALVFAGITLFLFSFQYGSDYSRIVLFLTFILHTLLGYVIRILWKKALCERGILSRKQETMLAVLQKDTADAMLDQLLASPAEGRRIVGAVVDGGHAQSVRNIPVVCSLAEAPQYICRKWIDSVYIDCALTAPGIPALISACLQMAVPVHYHVPGMGTKEANLVVEQICGSTVITSAAKCAEPWELIVKRMMDISGGLIGSVAALLILAFVGPKIRKESPGPLLYRSERIGKNGKKFSMLKIRSMYPDADKRKAALMDQNRVKDGMMFKMDFDPRVIGNAILPDGSRKTGIGDLIRRTSLDEFPQFFNVLKGDMSLVGTRPPTVDEWEKYEFHHRARLSCKPGITGMWQISGRSDITDFEQVVKLDMGYINNWSLKLDLKILWKTIGVVFRRQGAR